MKIERNTTKYKVITVGEIERGDIFELTIGQNVGVPILKVAYESDEESNEIVGFNLITNEEVYINKSEECFLAIDVAIKYDLQTADKIVEEEVPPEI